MLLIGATGKIGQHLVPALTAAGERPTVLARNPDAARATLGDGVDYLAGDLRDAGSLDAALAGHDVVYLANGQTDDQVALETAAIDAAVRAGVRRLVKISALGAQAGPERATSVFGRWHARIEQHLASTPLAATVLRPNIFTANLLGSAGQIAQGQLFSTTGDGATAWIDPADIAAVAAAALLDDKHAGQTYEITGPEAITHDELADRLSTVLGHPVQHLRIADADFRAALEGFGMPQWTVDAYVELDAAIRDGAAGTVSPDVPTVLGRPAGTVTAFLRSHAGAFAG
jgi:uncharacterized protein YbjT (DUF2867 family)